MKAMQAIILGMREGVGNMFPNIEGKGKKPKRSNTTLNVI
jgi:hypothetical protein